MLLVVDIGNSGIKYGSFNQEILCSVSSINTKNKTNIKKYTDLIPGEIKKYNISACVIASVADEYNEAVYNAIKDCFGIKAYIINSESAYGIKTIDTIQLKHAGIDRVANILQAIRKYGTPVIVVDAGTAITFDIADKNGYFIGGIIMPGLRLQLESLGNNTSKLPIYDIEESFNAIGTDTKSSIMSGVIRGTASAVDGLLTQCINELNDKPILIGTGGHIKIIAGYMRTKFDYIEPNHTIYGIKMLYDLNKIKQN